MPLAKGTSKAVTKRNFEEFGRGKTYARTKKRYGRKSADKQRVAIVLSNRRRSKHRKAYRKTKTR